MAVNKFVKDFFGKSSSLGLTGFLVILFLISLIIGRFFFRDVNASATILLRGTPTTANNGAGATGLVIAKPLGVVAGDVMIAQMVVNNVATIVTAPSGWVSIITTQSSSSVKQISYYKIATLTEPGSYNWIFSSSEAVTGGISAYSGVDNLSPIDTSSGKYNSSTATVGFTQIITTTPNDMILAVVGVSGNTTVTQPLGFTENYDTNNPATSVDGKTAEISEFIKSSVGTTSVASGLEDTLAVSNLAQLIALRPETVNQTPTPVPTPTATPNPNLSTTIKNVFVIPFESYGMADIVGNPSAPYINSLFPQSSYATQYYPAQTGINLSLPQYLWMEAGDNFGVVDDHSPTFNSQPTTDHLVTYLNNANITWKFYQEGISGQNCPVQDVDLYAVRHNPAVYFNDVSSNLPYCISHIRPYNELAPDLVNNTFARYNFITPDTCHDMHDNCTGDPIAQGDAWLAANLPQILNSQAYSDGGAVFITFDNDDSSLSNPIPMIVLSPLAKGSGYNNAISYNHGSLLKTIQEIFNVSPMLRNAVTVSDLSDLFVPSAFALPTPTPTATASPTIAPTPTIIPTPTPTLAPTPTPTQSPTPTPVPSPTPTPTSTPANTISLRSFSYTSTGIGSKTITLNKPVGVIQGDVLITQITVSSTSATVKAPIGWNLIISTSSTGSVKEVSYYKVATTSEPVSYTWTFDTTRVATAGVTAFLGVDPVSPINAKSGKYNDTTKNIAFTQITTTIPNTMLVALSGVSGNTTVTPSVGFSEVYDVNNTLSSKGKTVEMAQKTQLTSGITSVGNGLEDGAAVSNLAQLIALKPAGN